MSTTFIPKNESFTCANCQKHVSKAERGYRNHCPFCLHGLHVDVHPGDRANSCHGILKPTSVTKNSKGEWMLEFECSVCRAAMRNKTAPDDDMDKIIELSVNKKALFGE